MTIPTIMKRTREGTPRREENFVVNTPTINKMPASRTMASVLPPLSININHPPLCYEIYPNINVTKIIVSLFYVT